MVATCLAGMKALPCAKSGPSVKSIGLLLPWVKSLMLGALPLLSLWVKPRMLSMLVGLLRCPVKSWGEAGKRVGGLREGGEKK